MAGVRTFVTASPGSNGASIATTYPAITGSRIYVCSLSTVTSEAISSIADTLGNTYSEDIDSTVGAFRFEIWSAPNGSSGANSPAVTYSAFTAATKRLWIYEVVSVGTLSAGASDTHDQAAAQNPMTLASITSGGIGVAFLMVATDTAHTFSAWTGSGAYVDMQGGSSSRGAYAIISNGESIAPTMTNLATESGESLLMAFYDDGGGGPGGGGETSHVFS
jgi:hypothetical protein